MVYFVCCSIYAQYVLLNMLHICVLLNMLHICVLLNVLVICVLLNVLDICMLLNVLYICVLLNMLHICIANVLYICVLLNVLTDMCAAQYECVTRCAHHRVHCFMCSCMFDNFTGCFLCGHYRTCNLIC